MRREGQSIALAYPSFVHHAERRMQGRIDVELPVRVDGLHGGVVSGMIRDISRGGAALRLPSPAMPGLAVTANFALVNRSRDCKILAEVVRCSGPVEGEYAIGIRFAPDAPGLLQLEEWIVDQTYRTGL